MKKIDLQSYRYVMISAITLSGLLAAHVVVVVFFFLSFAQVYTRMLAKTFGVREVTPRWKKASHPGKNK